VTTTGATSSYPFLFGGMKLDSSGLYHTLTRTYSPTFGRFLSEDAGLAVNAFIYADDDPVDATDPTGMSPQYISGAGRMGAPSPDFPIDAAHSNSAGGGLAGAMLADWDNECNGCGDNQPFPAAYFSGTNMVAPVIAPAILGPQEIAILSKLVEAPGSQNVIAYLPAEFAGVPAGVVPTQKSSSVLELAQEEGEPDGGAGGPPLTDYEKDEADIAENESQIMIREFLKPAVQTRTGNFEQFTKGGGFAQANADFDNITSEFWRPVRDQGNGIRSSSLPNGGSVSVRPTSSDGTPTVQINIPGRMAIKIRY
jgi:RHS repeat-associated protein